ncbi:MAG: hypothetical protein ABSC25_24840 [Roseiarcus sp.]|jgi:hypothetical protein
MTIRRALMSIVILCVSSVALADSGTPEQRAACGPDVRRFCHKLKEADGGDAYLQCFELHRDDLSAACSAMLKNYGK